MAPEGTAAFLRKGIALLIYAMYNFVYGVATLIIYDQNLTSMASVRGMDGRNAGLHNLLKKEKCWVCYLAHCLTMTIVARAVRGGLAPHRTQAYASGLPSSLQQKPYEVGELSSLAAQSFN